MNTPQHQQLSQNEHTSNTNDDIPRPVYIYAACAALNSCNLGFDLGVSTNAGPLVQQEFQVTDDQLELFLGSLNFWSILGALLSPVVSDRYGRRATFQAAAMAFVVGCGVMATAANFEILMFGRFLVGVAVGIGEAIDPMYIAEIAPASDRGRLVSWAEAGVATGVVLGFSSSLVFYHVKDSVKWRYMLATGAILPLLMMGLVQWVMPESPRWLLAKNQDAAARVILAQITPPGEDLEHVVQTIRDSIELEEAASKAAGWKAIRNPSPAVQRMLLVGVGMAVIQQAIGIDSIMFYLLFVIKGSGVKSDLGQTLALILLGTVKLVFVFVGARLFDSKGRRPLLFTSLVGCALSLVVVSCSFASKTKISELTVVLGLASYLAFFSIGVGPGNWVVVSEIFSTSIRAKAMSVAILPNRITATVMASTFLSVADVLTWPGFFLLLAGVCLASTAFLYHYLPETKGKSLEQMAVYFAEVTGDRSILDVEERVRRERELEMSCVNSDELSTEDSENQRFAID